MPEDGDNSGYLLSEIGTERLAQEKAQAELAKATLAKFAKGQSGNPGGRRTGGAYVQECVNQLLRIKPDGSMAYTKAEIEALFLSPLTPPAMAMAAGRVRTAFRNDERFVVDRKGKVHPGGTDPEPGRAFAMIMDYTDGRPTQRVEVHRTGDRAPAEVEQELMSKLRASPQLLAVLLERLGIKALPAVIDVQVVTPPDQSTDLATRG